MQDSDISALCERKQTVPMLRAAEYAPESESITVTETHRLMTDVVFKCRKSAVREICARRIAKLAPRSELLAAKFGALVALVPAVAQPTTEPFFGLDPALVKNFLLVAMCFAGSSLLRDLVRILMRPETFGASAEQVVEEIIDELEGKEQPRTYLCNVKSIFR